MFRIILILVILIIQSLALERIDVLHKLANDFNRNRQLKQENEQGLSTNIAYAPYKINAIKEDIADILLVPTNCGRKEKNVTLKKCGFNRDHYFYNVLAEKKNADYEIKETRIFTNAKEILNIQNFDVLGFDSFENGTLISFYSYMKQHNRDYASVKEFNHRFAVFRRNSKMIKLFSIFDPTAKYGHTQFADMTYEEFSKRHLGYKKGGATETKVLPKSNLDDKDLPEEFDWRDHGAVTEVKNQESCGSCWAFSVVGNIEGRYYLSKNKLYSLSEQELVDCDTEDQGCNGGYPLNAYKSISLIGGLTTEDSYPYLGEKEDSCKLKTETIKVHVSKGIQIADDENEIAKELYMNGPVSMALNAFFLQFYFGGVSHPPKALCDSEGLDHAVLGVGFGVHTTSILHRHQPYWLIKNSWGKTWGEDGYFRIYRGDGTCGINEMVTTGVIS